MQIIKENNISTIIIVSTMLIISSLMIFNGWFFITKQYNILDAQIEDSKKTYVESQKNIIKREVDSIIEYITFKRTLIKNQDQERAFQEELKNWIRYISFGKDKQNYVFVYDVQNYEGGNTFATMLVNPNRPDIEGKFISDSYTDENGKAFRKIFLKDIREQGSSFVHYMYKKQNDTKARPKVSYFKAYPQWNWIIAAGAYLDDIDEEIATQKANLNKKVRLDVSSGVVIFLLFSLVANSFAIILGKTIEKFLNGYHAQIKQKNDELEVLNKTLENRVKDEIEKNRDQEQLLIQKSKFIALGEMISNIAHQWRQPLSQLSAIMMTVKLKYKLGKLDKQIVEEKSKEVQTILEYMSTTIDDFRNFFMPNKDKKLFSIKESIDEVLSIIGKSISNQNILIEVNTSKDESVFGYKNEYEQVLLNLLSNAKDAIIESGVAHGKITIFLKSDSRHIKLSVKDNGGGIKIRPIEKIFEPYVTTKEDSNGTGIGLYMSKLIIEKNMGGTLEVKNEDIGAKFTISLRRA
ncbi:MAG: cache domain-containing protein [Sulfurospirillaceae bacterium]|nr:cache domain-containing protein [Sulfurospirillaceae bacterium]